VRIGSSLVSGLAENIPQAVLRLPNARRTPGASIIYVEADSVADGFTVKKSSQQRLFVLGKLHSLQARDSTSSADADIFPSHQHDDRPRFRTLLLCLPRLPLIFGLNHLNAVWRITLGLGVVPPLFLLYFRLKMHEVNQLIIP